MKVKDLIKRKEELQNSKTTILKQIDEMTQDLEWTDLQKFIASGDSSQVDGHQLEKLQRKRKHLDLLEGSLNLEIFKTRKKERLSKLQKLERKAKELESKRKGTLYAKYLHFQNKIKALQAQDLQLKEELLAVKSKTFQFNREDLEIHFRLPELEKVLKDNYIQKPEELEKLVEKAYKKNEKVLSPGPDDISDELTRGYRILLNRDSGEVTEIEPLTCGADLARNHKNVMDEVRK